MKSAHELTGTFASFSVQRVASGSHATDEFDVAVTITVGSDSFVGSARVSRSEEQRITQYFIDISRVAIKLNGPIMVFVLDAGLPPMPAFRLHPSPVTTR